MSGARVLVAISLAASLHAAPQDPGELLGRVRAKAADLTTRLPRCTCTQSIDRTQYNPQILYAGDACDAGFGGRKIVLFTSDRLRLDVAIADDREMYSWVGERKFSDRSLVEMVQDGAITTGIFGSFLGVIFHAKDTTLNYRGEHVENGRTLSEFTFSVSKDKSDYTYGRGMDRVITGYQGSLLVDSKTAELVRMVIQTERLPWTSGACYAKTTLDYSHVRLRDEDFLLATHSTLFFLSVDGTESENHSVLSNCREFLGESNISFDVPADGAIPAEHLGQELRPLVLPPGLSFRVALTQAIDASKAAAGDPLKAKLITPITDAGSKVLVPAGAAVTARIVSLRQFYGAKSALSLGVTLETVEVGGVPMRLSAARYSAERYRKAANGVFERRLGGAPSTLEERSATVEFKNAKQPYIIRAGVESVWVTEN